MGRPIRVLVVDDSDFVRQRIADGLELDPDIEVVGVARDALSARRLLGSLEVDVMTLDIEMPTLNGLDFLRQLMPVNPVPVVMVSSFTREGTSVTMASLAAGAVDFAEKPARGGAEEKRFLEQLRTKVRAAATANLGALRPVISEQPERIASTQPGGRYVVAIGASTGGPEALHQVFERLPADSPPIVVVQHMPARYTPKLAAQLDRCSGMEVRHASDGEEVAPGVALVAPGGEHMRIALDRHRLRVACGPGEPVNGHVPSVDVLFHSVAEVLGRRTIGVLLTGMGADGADGLGAMRAAGARTLAQDEETSVVFGMPKAAHERGAAERLVALPLVAQTIFELIGEDASDERRGGRAR